MKLLVGTGSFRLGLTLFCGRYFPWLDFFLCLQVRGWVRVIPKGSIVFGCCLTYIQACTVVYGLCFQNVLASRSPLLDTRKTYLATQLPLFSTSGSFASFQHEAGLILVIHTIYPHLQLSCYLILLEYEWFPSVQFWKHKSFKSVLLLLSTFTLVEI